MKAIEIVEIIKKENPKLMGNMQDKKVARIINKSLKVLCQQIKDTNEGRVRVPGLGSFNVKQVEREKDGIKRVVKRVIFRPSKKKEATPNPS